MWTLINHFGLGASLVAIKPFPLQFEHKHKDARFQTEWDEKTSLDDFPTDQKTGMDKLEVYYSELGFVHLEDSELMILSTALKNPSPWSKE